MPLDPISPGETGAARLTICRLTRDAPDGPAPSLRHWRRAVEQGSSVWVGLDRYKAKIAVAVASLGRAEKPAGEAVRAAKKAECVKAAALTS